MSPRRGMGRRVEDLPIGDVQHCAENHFAHREDMLLIAPVSQGVEASNFMVFGWQAIDIIVYLVLEE